MTTALDIITQSMGALGLANIGETLSAEDSADALKSLNSCLDTLRNQRAACYALQDESLTLVVSQPSYTIGSGGDLDTTRPVRIEGSYVRDSSGDDTPVKVTHDAREYAGVADKSATGETPDLVYYARTMSTGTLYVYPVPTVAYTLHLLTWTPFTAFAGLSTAVTLPPGYEELLIYKLARRLAPKNGVPVPVEVRELEREAMRGIRQINSTPIKMTTGLPELLGAAHTANIETDE